MKKIILVLLILFSLVMPVGHANESIDTFYKKENSHQFSTEYVAKRTSGCNIVNCLDGGYIVQYDANSLIKTDNNFTVQWFKKYDSLISIGNLVSIIDGGYFCAGIPSKGEACVMRLDDNGTIIWQKTLEGSANDSIAKITPSSSGEILLCGRTNSTDGIFSGNKGQKDIFAVKMDFDGNIKWSKTYGGSNDDDCYDCIKTNDGGFVLCGSTQSWDGDINAEIPGWKDGLFLKIDSDGNMQWSKAVGYPNFQEYLKDVVEDSDGYVAIGSQIDDYKCLAFKVDLNGNILWGYLCDEKDSFFNQIYKQKNGNYIVIGNRITFFNKDGEIQYQSDKYKISAVGRSNSGGLIESKINDFALTPYKVVDSNYELLNKRQIVKSEDEINVVLNNKVLSFDQNPIVENDRTLVPMRKICESLNAKVDWDEKNNTVTINKDSKNVILKIDSINATVNGSAVKMDVPAKVINGRTLVPLRFVSETLGLTLKWDDANQIIYINNSNIVQESSSEITKIPSYITDICNKSLVEIEATSVGGPKRKFIGYAVNYNGKNVILTNLSSIISERNIKLKVTFQDGKSFEVYKTAGFDLNRDIAMIQCKLDNIQLPNFKPNNLSICNNEDVYIVTSNNKVYGSKISDVNFKEDNIGFIGIDKVFSMELNGSFVLNKKGDFIGLTSARNSNKSGKLLLTDLNQLNIASNYPVFTFGYLKANLIDTNIYEEKEPNEVFTYNTHVPTILPNAHLSGKFDKAGDLDLYIIEADHSCKLKFSCALSSSDSNIKIEDVIGKIHLVLDKKEITEEGKKDIVIAEGKKVYDSSTNTWKLEIEAKLDLTAVGMGEVEKYNLKIYCDSTDPKLTGISYIIDYTY